MTSSSGVLAAFPCLHPREQVALGGDTTGSGTLLVRELHARGITTRQGAAITKGFLYRLLNNRA